MRGIIILTRLRLRGPLSRDEPLYEPGELQQIGEPAQRKPASRDNREVGNHDIGPLQRNRGYPAILEAQQQPLASPVDTLTDTDGPLPGIWVERVGDDDKLPRYQRITCTPT
ncbi:MAG: hypothetical protein CMN64_00380 [Sphingobium sp.]|jgi:hypothetical protein|nr:hypothetical protein [Sphingobium sp.]|tara:strand:- start:3352 stop:3687 length:336 start_codon:yes stop_codon:yes gene_type:complete